MPSSAWKKKECSRSEEHTSELQSLTNIVCRLLLEKTNNRNRPRFRHLGRRTEAHPEQDNPASTRTIEPARARVVEALALKRSVSDLVNQDYALTPAEIDLMWQTASPRMP